MPLNAPVEEVIHGVKVCDPYRWLEERALPETAAWIGAQQQRCEDYFRACPDLEAIEQRVRRYLDVEVVDQPARVANRYLYRKRSKGTEQGQIYLREAASSAERLLVDPSPFGPYTSVGIHRISPDGAYLAFEYRRGGEDRKEIHFVDLSNGQILPDVIAVGYARGVVFVGSGYLYSQETGDQRAEHLIRYHAFGSKGADPVVFRAARTEGSRVVLTGNARRAGVLWSRPYGRSMIADFAIAALQMVPKWETVFRQRRLPYNPWLCGDRIFVLTGTDHVCSRLIELSTGGQELRVLIPEKEVPIRRLLVASDRIFASYQERGQTTIDAWQPDGKQGGSIMLPAEGTVEMLPAQVQGAESFFLSHQSYNQPPTLYEYCVRSNQATLWHQRSRTNSLDVCHIRKERVIAKDGTAIPLTLVGRRDRVPGPMLMTSYGGFGISMTPQFSVLVTIMMELGVTLAIPHIRGGGDFGPQWHDAGRARNRQVAFNDFLAAAEWLCREGFTTPAEFGIFGGSNSGLLVAAAMTQRPGLFGAVLCIAPLLDMVRYEAFDDAVKWRSEFGTVSDPEDFQALAAYSPYHRIADQVNYPATLFVSGDKDDRCNPAHTRKMAARLGERSSQTSPVIVDYSTERGHAPSLPLSVRISALARRIAFLCRELHISVRREDFDETPHS